MTLTSHTAKAHAPRLRARGLLFDSDGVLVDSLYAAEIAWSAWAQRWAPSFDFTRDMPHGVRAVDIIAGLVNWENVETALAELDTLELATAQATVAIMGAVEITSSLAPDRWAVVTSATRDLACRRLSASGHPTPRLVVTAEDVARGKPDPEPYLKAAHGLGFSPADCVVFEDAEAGVQAARAAGVGHVVGVGDHLGSAWVDIVIADLTRVSVDGDYLVFRN